MGLDGGSCWNFTTTKPLGNLNPYFSKTENKIYLNRECAICNNVNSITEKSFFTPRIKCHYATEAMFKTINELVKADSCEVSFVPDDDIFPRLCDKQCGRIYLIDKCNSKKLIEPTHKELGLSYVRMKQLCLSNFSQPFCYTKSNFVYKNIYCYACQQVTANKLEQPCKFRYLDTDRDTLVTFSIFLDSTELTLLNDRGMTRSVQLMACGHARANHWEVSVNICWCNVAI